jgi:SAM-dependent methyltransferase
MRKPTLPASHSSKSSVILGPILRLFFYLLYQPFAWTYDWVASFVSNSRWKDWIAQTQTFVQGPNLLELGHGPGHLQLLLAQNPALHVFGLDRSKQMGRLAHRRLARAGISPMLTRATAQALPFSDGGLNTIVATFPTEYIADPATIQEMQRVLAPDGRVVILLASWITGHSLTDRFLAWLYRFTGQTLHPDEDLNLHNSPFQRAGFSIHTEYITLKDSRLLFVIAQKLKNIDS